MITRYEQSLRELCKDIDIADSYPKTIPIALGELSIKNRRLYYLGKEVDPESIIFNDPKLEKHIKDQLK